MSSKPNIKDGSIEKRIIGFYNGEEMPIKFFIDSELCLIGIELPNETTISFDLRDFLSALIDNIIEFWYWNSGIEG